MSTITSIRINSPAAPIDNLLVCTARDQAGHDVTSLLVWGSMDTQLLQPYGGRPGVFRVLGEGFTEVYAYYGTNQGPADHIPVGFPWITAVHIIPQDATMAFSASCQACFTAKDQLGRDITSMVTWGSMDPRMAWCTATQPGVFHVEGMGTTKVYAYYLDNHGPANNTSLTVGPAGVLIVPADKEFAFSYGGRLSFRATDLEGRDITSLLTWGTMSPKMLEAEQNQPGVFTMWNVGSTQIFAFFINNKGPANHTNVTICPAQTASPTPAL